MAVLRRARHVTLRDGREAVVRSAVPGDAGRLRRLIDAVAAEPEVTLLMLPGQFGAGAWRRRITDAATDPHSLLLVAEVGDRLVGNLGLRPDPHPASAHVVTVGMSVGRSWRGLGVGSSLLEIAADWAHGRGCRKITLSVFPHNTRGDPLLRGQGLRARGAAPRPVRARRQQLDEVLMARLLDESFVWTAPPAGGR